MHSTRSSSTAPTGAIGVASLPLLAVAALVTAVLALVVQLTGAVEAASAPFLWAGVGAAALAGTIATALHVRAVRRDPIAEQSARFAAQRLQTLLGLAFAIKLMVAAAGSVLLWSLGVKFPQLATFALAFAASSLILHGTVAAGFARMLAERSRTRPESSPS